mmetsp:Transcript_32341/g.100060  ORF Transcript_32341/g.100060 Transcript_32341/m.100060 type:complete len:264 (-) Transcript_32341:437-1228(-)
MCGSISTSAGLYLCSAGATPKASTWNVLANVRGVRMGPGRSRAAGCRLSSPDCRWRWTGLCGAAVKTLTGKMPESLRAAPSRPFPKSTKIGFFLLASSSASQRSRRYVASSVTSCCDKSRSSPVRNARNRKWLVASWWMCSRFRTVGRSVKRTTSFRLRHSWMGARTVSSVCAYEVNGYGSGPPPLADANGAAPVAVSSTGSPLRRRMRRWMKAARRCSMCARRLRMRSFTRGSSSTPGSSAHSASTSTADRDGRSKTPTTSS